MILLSIANLLLIRSLPLRVTDFVFCPDIGKPYSVIIWFNLCAAFCGLSTVLEKLHDESFHNLLIYFHVHNHDAMYHYTATCLGMCRPYSGHFQHTEPTQCAIHTYTHNQSNTTALLY
jgi:hypothetical protein